MRRTALALVSAMLAASCTSERADPQPAPTTAAPAPAGTLRIGYPAEPPTLNPVSEAGGSRATRDLLRPTLPALFRLDARLRPQPELAERYPRPGDITRDPFTVTVSLREASWSDGAPIGAADVRFTWERLRDGPTRARYRPVRDVEVVSPRRVKLVFDRPLGRWWSLFSIDDPILPAHAFGDGSAWTRGAPVSGGPFVFDSWTPGLSIRLRRNDNYWGTRASVEAIDVIFVPDDETRLFLLERDELDLAFAEGDAAMGARARARKYDETDGALDGGPAASGVWGAAWWELDVNLSRLGGKRVLAEAIALALDRPLFAELLEDTGQVMDGIPARFPARVPDKEGRPELAGPWRATGGDLDAARRALSAAGYRRTGDELRSASGEVSLLLAYPRSGLTAPAIARLVHFRMRELGMRIELAGVEPDRFESEWIPNSRADLYLILRRGADAPDVAAYHSSAGPLANPARLSGVDAEIDAALLLEDVASGEGPATGVDAGAWTRAQERMAASRAILPLVRVRSWIVSRGGVAGPQATGTLAGPLWNAETWRLAG